MLAAVHVLARVPVHVLVVTFLEGLVLSILSCNQVLHGILVLIADLDAVTAIYTILPAVDLRPRLVPNVLGANDGTRGQENTAEKALE